MPASIPVTVTFEVKRIEETRTSKRAQRNIPEPSGGKFAQFLGADKLVPLIYEYVVGVMSYDKSGKGWGRGDALYACDVRRGNCTDFHSLFMALARSRGIPARFTIGFPIGKPKFGQVPGYHCWAEFYAGSEWVPIDASEAWKNPARHDYYFGHLDAARVAFTMGRDLELTPHQQGGRSITSSIRMSRWTGSRCRRTRSRITSIMRMQRSRFQSVVIVYIP